MLPLPNATTLVSTGLYSPSGVAVDGAGNVYIADYWRQRDQGMVAASNTVTTLVSSGLYSPYGVAVDGLGNVYIADTYNNAIKEWLAASNTVITLVSSGLSGPYGVAVDGAGNVYIADTYNNAIKEWLAASNTVTTLVSSGLILALWRGGGRRGQCLHRRHGNNAIKEWMAASNTVTTLVSSGLYGPTGVAVDGAGNVYIADNWNNAIKEWVAASNTVTTLVSSGLSSSLWCGGGWRWQCLYRRHWQQRDQRTAPRLRGHHTQNGTSIRRQRYIAHWCCPPQANLTGPFAPVSDSPWLTITGVTNGVVSFAFTANPSATNRTANLTVLGMVVPVTQRAAPVLTDVAMLNNGAFQFGFSNNQSASYTVWTTTNLSLPLTNWTLLGPPESNGSGQYQFTDPAATNDVQRFYRVTSP